MLDAFKNFSIGSVATPPSPATSGASLTLTSGQGGLFPDTPFNLVLCPPGGGPTAANAEIVRVTGRAGDVLTIVRSQEGTTAKAVAADWQAIAGVTAKTFQDLQPWTTLYELTGSTMDPFVVTSGTWTAVGAGVFRNTNTAISRARINTKIPSPIVKVELDMKMVASTTTSDRCVGALVAYEGSGSTGGPLFRLHSTGTTPDFVQAEADSASGRVSEALSWGGDDVWKSVKIIKSGDSMACWLDGTLRFVAADMNTFNYNGLYVGLWSRETTAEFRNVKVSIPSWME